MVTLGLREEAFIVLNEREASAALAVVNELVSLDHKETADRLLDIINKAQIYSGDTLYTT